MSAKLKLNYISKHLKFPKTQIDQTIRLSDLGE